MSKKYKKNWHVCCKIIFYLMKWNLQSFSSCFFKRTMYECKSVYISTILFTNQQRLYTLFQLMIPNFKPYEYKLPEDQQTVLVLHSLRNGDGSQHLRESLLLYKIKIKIQQWCKQNLISMSFEWNLPYVSNLTHWLFVWFDCF